MSVYSGFATRLLETQYNGLVCKLISLLEKRVVTALRGGLQHADLFDAEQWTLSFTSVYRGLRRMEAQKYQQPRFSACCRDLADFFSISHRDELHREESSRSSRLSTTGKEWESTMHQ